MKSRITAQFRQGFNDSYSGKLLVRMPKSLHRRLAETSEREGVSLNQYIVSLLSAME